MHKLQLYKPVQLPRHLRPHRGLYSSEQGNIVSNDTFYAAEGTNNADGWRRMGALAVEMEAAGLYANAAYAHKRALCICTISDHIYRAEALSSEQRQTSFTQMMEIALDTAVKMAQL